MPRSVAWHDSSTMKGKNNIFPSPFSRANQAVPRIGAPYDEDDDDEDDGDNDGDEDDDDDDDNDDDDNDDTEEEDDGRQRFPFPSTSEGCITLCNTKQPARQRKTVCKV